MDPTEPPSITLDILKKIHDGIGDLRRGLEGVCAGLDRVEGEVGGLREDVRGNSRRLDAVDGQLEAVDGQLKAVDGQLKSHGKRIGAVEMRMHELVQVTTLSISRQFDLGHRVDAIEERVAALESR